jgi:hypothetical protein
MKKRQGGHYEACDARRLAERASQQGVELDDVSLHNLACLDDRAAIRKLESVCRLIRAACGEEIKLSFRQALRRVEMCGGNAEEAIRRMLAGGMEAREGVCETVEYAAERGIVFAPRSIYNLLNEHGLPATRRYIDKLSAIMKAALSCGMGCTQTLATRRLARAGGDAQRAIADLAAEYQRRVDRRSAVCRVPVPPRTYAERSNALAECGCQHCCDRLAVHLQSYIGKMIAASLFSGLEREEARAEANLVLMSAIETWPGGNFIGWFTACFTSRVMNIYVSRTTEERRLASLDAPAVLADDEGGRIVPLGERIPDRSVNTLIIVLLRERMAEAVLELRRQRVDRAAEFTNRLSRKALRPDCDCE